MATSYPVPDRNWGRHLGASHPPPVEPFPGQLGVERDRPGQMRWLRSLHLRLGGEFRMQELGRTYHEKR